MHQISFSPEFESELKGQLGKQVEDVKADLKLHLDAIGSSNMPIPYLGKTDPFDYPQPAADADLKKIHIFDSSCPTFGTKEQNAWNKATALRYRTSDTYFVYTVNYFDEYHCHFVGVVSPAHEKCNVTKSGFKWFSPLIDAANKFNGM